MLTWGTTVIHNNYICQGEYTRNTTTILVYPERRQYPLQYSTPSAPVTVSQLHLQYSTIIKQITFTNSGLLKLNFDLYDFLLVLHLHP